MTTASSPTTPHLIAPPKTARDESFPVAWLLPRRLRRPVHAYYGFARQADDVADSPVLSSEDKIARLDALEASLHNGTGDGAALHRVLAERAIDDSVATDLLAAFRRDALNPPCETWADLMEYCRLSAMPVGRFLLAVSDEPATPEVFRASDALCAALQILNHIQGCGEDWHTLGRLYIPAQWLAEQGLTAEVLSGDHSPAGLRMVLDRVLANTDAVLREAAPLPRLIHHRRLRMQAAATLHLARVLRRRLAVGDPLADRIRPTHLDWMKALGRALRAGVRP